MNRNIVSPCRTGHRILMLPFFLLLLAMSGTALAEGTWDDCTVVGSSIEYYPPTTAAIPSGLNIGDPFGPWITASAAPAWTCTRRTTFFGTVVIVTVEASPPYGPLGSLSMDGRSYNYYAVGPSSPDLAYIARWRATINGTPTDWTPLVVSAPGYMQPAESVTVIKNASDTNYTISIETQIRLVKRTNNLGPSSKLSQFDPISTRFVQRVGAVAYGGLATYRTSRMNGGNLSLGTEATCTTPDVNVALPATPRDSFTGIGTNVGETPFDLLFNNCPAGLYSIEYTLAPTTTVIDAADGVVGLNAASTASGVGIRVSQSDGTPLQFNTSYKLDSYDAWQAGDYRVGLRAGYRQTQANVVPGSASTALTMSVLYK